MLEKKADKMVGLLLFGTRDSDMVIFSILDKLLGGTFKQLQGFCADNGFCDDNGFDSTTWTIFWILGYFWVVIFV